MAVPLSAFLPSSLAAFPCCLAPLLPCPLAAFPCCLAPLLPSLAALLPCCLPALVYRRLRIATRTVAAAARPSKRDSKPGMKAPVSDLLGVGLLTVRAMLASSE